MLQWHGVLFQVIERAVRPDQTAALVDTENAALQADLLKYRKTRSRTAVGVTRMPRSETSPSTSCRTTSLVFSANRYSVLSPNSLHSMVKAELAYSRNSEEIHNRLCSLGRLFTSSWS